MNKSPYSRFECNDLILRDELAVDRTLLANERTLLAYLRSGAALLITGASILHFSTESWFWAVGMACIPAGIITGIVGIARYRRMKKSISLFRRQSDREKKKNGKIDSWSATYSSRKYAISAISHNFRVIKRLWSVSHLYNNVRKLKSCGYGMIWNLSAGGSHPQ